MPETIYHYMSFNTYERNADLLPHEGWVVLACDDEDSRNQFIDHCRPELHAFVPTDDEIQKIIGRDWYVSRLVDDVDGAHKVCGVLSEQQISDTAASLYDGGWRADDREEMISEYGFFSDDADKVCKMLGDIEKNKRVQYHVVRLMGAFRPSSPGKMDANEIGLFVALNRLSKKDYSYSKETFLREDEARQRFREAQRECRVIDFPDNLFLEIYWLEFSEETLNTDGEIQDACVTDEYYPHYDGRSEEGGNL
jgi:hypothetical protein